MSRNQFLIALSALSLGATTASAEEVALRCPEGTFVRKVIAYGTKGMYLNRAGYDNGFDVQQGANCRRTHGWDTFIKQIQLGCWNPVSREYVKSEVADSRLFEDKYFSPTYEKAKVKLGKECAENEMAVFHPESVEVDPFCESRERSLEAFKCVPLNPVFPMQKFQLLSPRSPVDAYVVKLGDTQESSQAQLFRNYTFFNNVINHGLIPLESLEAWGQAFQVGSKLDDVPTRRIIALLESVCHLNVGMNVMRANFQMNYETIDQKQCWFDPKGSQFTPNTLLNDISYHVEAAARALSGQYYLEKIRSYKTPTSFDFGAGKEVLFRHAVKQARERDLRRQGMKDRDAKDQETQKDLEGLPKLEQEARAEREAKDAVISRDQELSKAWGDQVESYVKFKSSAAIFEALRRNLESLLNERDPEGKSWRKLVEDAHQFTFAPAGTYGGTGQIPTDGSKHIKRIQESLKEMELVE